MPGDFMGKVLDEVATRRTERQALAASRMRAMRESSPEVRSLDARIARASLQDRASLPNLLVQRDSAVSQWLSANAKPEDWLLPKFDCALCQDLGYADGRLCTCVRNEAARRMYNEAGLNSASPCFEKFDLSLFPNDEKLADGRSIREWMTFLRDMGLSYSDRFPELQKPNLLFTGPTGCGKSFLLDSIVGRVISRGYWVVRATAFSVNDVMAKALFDRADPDSLFDCDLLALDDLGTEPILNKVTISSFFNLLNERVTQGRPFIISTNLNEKELLLRYGERVFSRIADTRTTRVLPFAGVDLRRGL